VSGSHVSDAGPFARLRCGLGALLAALAGGGIVWLVTQQLQGPIPDQLRELRAERRQLARQVAELSDARAELERKVAMLERSRRVDEAAYGEIRSDRARLEAEIRRLREDLAFYRGVMSPAQARSGLGVQDFRVQRSGDGERRYHFRMLLTQSRRHDRLARGQLYLNVEGERDGVTERLSLRQASPEETAAIGYRFRYFQEIEGDLVLPEGFRPLRVVVKLVPSAKKTVPVEWTFDWPVVGAGADS